jgi:hypothetical protein
MPPFAAAMRSISAMISSLRRKWYAGVFDIRCFLC